MKEIGEYLKASREEKGISIEEVSEDLKLDNFAIEQIEEGNKDIFKDIYELRTFVQQYSKYLCLDVEKITEEFNDFMFEYTSKIPIVEEIDQSKTESNKKKIASPYTIEECLQKKKTNKIIIIGIIAIALIIGLILIFVL